MLLRASLSLVLSVFVDSDCEACEPIKASEASTRPSRSLIVLNEVVNVASFSSNKGEGEGEGEGSG